jgi:hypothetical protein
MKITITIEQYEKLKRLSDFADWYIDDYPKHMYPEQYESDKEEITQAQEVIQEIDSMVDFEIEQAKRAARTDEWIKQTNKNIREGIA